MTSAFSLHVPTSTNAKLVELPAGEALFILGPNGVGKSRLMHLLYTANQSRALRISAHRQNWFNNNGGALTASNRNRILSNSSTQNSNTESVYIDRDGESRINVVLFDLVAAQNERGRKIAEAVDANQIEQATTLAYELEAPIKILNELLRLSNLPIVTSLTTNGEIFASKSGSKLYGINQLSDGERNALIIIASVLTAEKGKLILIDEPERHLHHSISSPLLSLLISKRPDCSFIISTHDIMLPLNNKKANVLLVRSCEFAANSGPKWDIDFLSSGSQISEQTKKDILGSRRKMLYIEGTSESLDVPFYSLIFPNVSIVSKRSCREIEKTVPAIRQEENAHWLKVFGIIDNDGRSQEEIDQLRTQGVYALPFYSVEALYYHPEIQKRIAVRQAAITGKDATTYATEAQASALKAIKDQAPHLSRRIAEKTVREKIFNNLPSKDVMENKTPIQINIDVAEIVQKEEETLNTFLKKNDFLSILKKYPIRESGALSTISTNLQFPSRSNYESAVIKLLIDDESALDLVRSFLGTLFTDISE